MRIKRQKIKINFFITISIVLLAIAVGLRTVDAYSKEQDYDIQYEYINVKDMAQVQVANKIDNGSIIENLMNGTNQIGTIEEVAFPSLFPNAEVNTPRAIWRLPTEIGRVTQSPHFGHAALDISSPRGSGEFIFPVANGVISGIYTDPAGALVITILHNIDGKKYTSQYAHFSSYASGLYIGKEVTVNDCLGRMGSTGYSTGVHLHLAVVDCALFDPNDYYCKDLNGFFRYANTRVTQGYLGLGSHIIVPGEWNSR